MLHKIARNPVAIVKTFNLYMFYDIFMALCYILISLSICTFEVCCKTPCGETSYFSGIIQLICDASKVSALCKEWVFTVENIRANYRFFCFDINKLLCYLIFRKSSCTTDVLVSYLDAGYYRSVEGENRLLH